MRAPVAIAAFALLLVETASATQRIGRRDYGREAPQTDEKTVTLARALDKVTAEISELELPSDEEVAFGSLLITARHCYSRPPEEPPETFAFLEIEEEREGERQRLFTGWMLASSPALHALEHPVYDVWVTGCRTIGEK